MNFEWSVVLGIVYKMKSKDFLYCAAPIFQEFAIGSAISEMWYPKHGRLDIKKMSKFPDLKFTIVLLNKSTFDQIPKSSQTQTCDGVWGSYSTNL
mgnify:CR=1 FL=1